MKRQYPEIIIARIKRREIKREKGEKTYVEESGDIIGEVGDIVEIGLDPFHFVGRFWIAQ